MGGFRIRIGDRHTHTHTHTHNSEEATSRVQRSGCVGDGRKGGVRRQGWEGVWEGKPQLGLDWLGERGGQSAEEEGSPGGKRGRRSRNDYTTTRGRAIVIPTWKSQSGPGQARQGRPGAVQVDGAAAVAHSHSSGREARTSTNIRT